MHSVTGVKVVKKALLEHLRDCLNCPVEAKLLASLDSSVNEVSLCIITSNVIRDVSWSLHQATSLLVRVD